MSALRLWLFRRLMWLALRVHPAPKVTIIVADEELSGEVDLVLAPGVGRG